jgi:hypothetical protein
MQTKTTLLFLLLTCVATPLTRAQESRPAQEEPAPTNPPQKPKLPGKFKQRVEDPFAKLVPGQLPEGTSAEAGALFAALSHSTLAPGTERMPLQAFDLAFEIITRGPGTERNQAEVRVRFQEPRFVRFAIGKDKEMGFGPHGFWQRFEDGAKFLNSRDYVSDRKRITEVRSVAKNFLVLADPSRLRLVSLKLRAAVPAHVPPGLEKRVHELSWLELESPDFDLALGATDGDALAPRAPRLFRATLGLDATTGRVLEALVQELDKECPLENTSTWVSLSEPFDIDTRVLPGKVEVRYPDFDVAPWSFDKKPREVLYLIEGTLNPKLPENAFEPPRL